MKHRIIDQLRPTDLSGVAPDWTERQAEIWADITDRTSGEERTQPRRLRRRTVLRVGVAAAAAALVAGGVAPIVLPHGSPEARAELEMVAESARRADPLVVEPGTFLYVATEEEYPNYYRTGTMRRYLHETWTGSDGSVVIGGMENGVRWKPNGPHPAEFSPTGFGQNVLMPRQPAALEAWLRLRVVGSTNQDEAVFVALTDMLRENNPDPELRAVMIETMPRVSHVRVETHRTDSHGRPAVMISRAEPARQGYQDHYYFDPVTGRFLEQARTAPDGTSTYRGTRVEERIVNSRPA